MGKANDWGLKINGDTVTVFSDPGFKTTHSLSDYNNIRGKSLAARYRSSQLKTPNFAQADQLYDRAQQNALTQADWDILNAVSPGERANVGYAHALRDMTPGLLDQSYAKQDEYVNSQKSQALNNFLKTSALAAALVGGGAALGAFSPASTAATTGVSAGSAAPAVASGGGASSFGSFATNAALKGALTGGVSGFASGGDVASALKGAGLGAVTGGYGGALGRSLGLGNVGKTALTGALTGASGGLATGDTKTALLGAGLGGLGGYISGGGLGNTAVGRALDLPKPEVYGPPAPTSATQTAVSGGGGLGGLGNLKSFIGPAASIYGGISDNKALDDAEQQQLRAQSALMAQLQPYSQAGLQANNQLSQNLAQGFNPGDLTADPGYQFRQQEGQKALDRSLAAQGMGQSGAAIKAAQQYSQGLAATEYSNAYDRWLAQNQQLAGQGRQGYDAATGVGNAYVSQGDTRASTTINKASNKNKTIASILQALGLME